MEPRLRRNSVPESADPHTLTFLVDVTVGVSALTAGAAVALARRSGSILEPVARVVLDPPMLPPSFRPARWLGSLARRGAHQRVSVRLNVSHLLDTLVPLVADEVLSRGDLTAMITRYIDLDRIAAEIDLDEAVNRLDVDAVAGRLDLDRVIERIDLVRLASEVIDAIDLPDIVRESTGSMASDTVHGARMQGIAADEVVGRVVDRLLLRRGRGSRAAPEPGATGSA